MQGIADIRLNPYFQIGYLIDKVEQCALSSDTLSRVRTLRCQVKLLFFARENNFSKIVNELLVLKLFQLSNEDLLISSYIACKCVITDHIPNSGQNLYIILS